MKDKKTLKEIFAEARRARESALGLENDPEALEALKTVIERRGDAQSAFEIQNQIDKLRRHTYEEIFEILEKDHVYYSANRLSITALYDWEDVKKDLDNVMDNMIDDNKRDRIIPCSWSVCRESDEIKDIELYDGDRPFTLHLPMDSFDTAEEVVDRFFELYELEENGINTSKRCETCKLFSEDGMCGPHKGISGGDNLACLDYEVKDED